MVNFIKQQILTILVIFCVYTIAISDTLSLEATELSQLVPSQFLDAVTIALQNAGDNASQLIDALTGVPDEHRYGLSFLIAYMPEVDLAGISSEILIENVHLAYQTKELFDWAKTIPEDCFLHYVLPHRVSQEPIEQWRRLLFDMIYPRVKELTTMEEVALEVNRWAGEHAKYKYTQPRDQGPLETLKSKYGRCEELVILFVDGCRAVGIPSRKVWVPWWSTKDDNHAWAEVWVDGKWYYTGAAEPKERLNHAWFDDTVKRTPLVLATCYGIPSDESQIYKIKGKHAILNVTDTYTTTGTIKVKVVNIPSLSEEIPVNFAVFNFGALRNFAIQKIDERGEVTLDLGPGMYFISAGNPERYNWQILSIKPNETQNVVLDLSISANNDTTFWLRYPGEKE